MRYKTAFTSNRDGGPDIVTGDHAAGEVSGAESVDVGRSVGFELVLKDNEAEELQVGLCLFTAQSV